jgi:hypothetical protein
MILFDPIIEVLAPTDPDRLQGRLRCIGQAVFNIGNPGRLVIGLTAINDNGVRASMAGKRLAQEAFGHRQVSVLASLGVGKSRCWQVSVLAEEERHPVADAVDGTV